MLRHLWLLAKTPGAYRRLLLLRHAEAQKPLSPDVLGSRAELLRRSMMSGSDLSHVSKTARHGASAARRARIGVVNGWSGWAISGGVFLGKGVISDLSGTIPLV